MSGSESSDSDESSVLSDVDDVLRDQYNSHLAEKYINPKSLKSTNRGWKTEKEINVLFGKVKSRNDFEVAKRAHEVDIGRTITSLEYKHLPKNLKNCTYAPKRKGDLGLRDLSGPFAWTLMKIKSIFLGTKVNPPTSLQTTTK